MGGLLTLRDVASNTRQGYAYDGNGNVTKLVNLDSGAVSADYAYGSFGEPLRAAGALAQANPFRWSTRYDDDETGIVIYPIRPYQPSTGRFLSRDPIEDAGGAHLFGFVGNNPTNRIDPLGLRELTSSETGYVNELESQAAQYSASNPELATALRAVKADYKSLIADIKGKNDPARVLLLGYAFEAWTDAGSAEKYRVKNDNGFKCSLLVRRSLSARGSPFPEWSASDFVDEVGTLKSIYKIQGKKVAGYERVDSSRPEVTINVRVPRIGDVVAMGDIGVNRMNGAHVGIYLGSGLFLNATLHVGPANLQFPDTAGQPTDTGGVGIKFVPELSKSGHEIIIYRSPDRQ